MNKISIFSGVLLASISSVCASSQQKPDIIFILCDDMGYGDLGCYAYSGGYPFSISGDIRSVPS